MFILTLTIETGVLDPLNPNNDDFELWSPAEQRQERCLFGRKVCIADFPSGMFSFSRIGRFLWTLDPLPSANSRPELLYREPTKD